MTIPDELSAIQQRVNALKPKPKPIPKQGKVGATGYTRPKGSRVIDGKLYTPEQLQEMGLEHGDQNKPRKRGKHSERTRTGGDSASLQGNQREPGATTAELYRRDTRYPGRGESDPADLQRPAASADQPKRDGGETESATRDRDARPDSGDDRAQGIAARISAGSQRAVNNAFEWMANIGKPKEDGEEVGPSRDDGNGFHPVERVADFIDEEYARVFSEREASDREQEVIDMIVGYSYDLDEFLSISNADGFRATGATAVWAMEHEEAAPIARIWLKRAKKDKRAAAVLRLAMQGDDYKRAAIVLGPRVLASAQWYPRHGGFRMQPWDDRKGGNPS